MSAARTGFTASDAERQTADSATNYMNRALRMLAERLGLEKSLERDPAAFVVQFAPLLSALIEAQAREFHGWSISEKLELLADASERGLSDLAGVSDKRLESLDESLLSGLADLAEHWEEMNAGTCRTCAQKARAAHWKAQREAREAAENGE